MCIDEARHQDMIWQVDGLLARQLLMSQDGTIPVMRLLFTTRA